MCEGYEETGMMSTILPRLEGYVEGGTRKGLSSCGCSKFYNCSEQDEGWVAGI